MGNGKSSHSDSQQRVPLQVPENVIDLQWYSHEGKPDSVLPNKHVEAILNEFNHNTGKGCRYWMQMARPEWMEHSFWTKAIMTCLWIQKWPELRRSLCESQEGDERESRVAELGNILGYILLNNLQLAQSVQKDWEGLCRFHETFQYFDDTLSPPRDMMISYMLYATEPHNDSTIQQQYKKIQQLSSELQSLTTELKAAATR